MVKKTDWKTVEMPEQTEKFVMQKLLNPDEMERIKNGHLPEEMEGKWFMYYDEQKLYIHRSWTGYCIYIIHFSEHGNLDVTVNRNPGQYEEHDIEKDRIMVNILINQLAGRKGENAAWMKRYLERKKQ